MWQQQAFVLDSKFNAYRAPNHPNFSKFKHRLNLIYGLNVINEYKRQTKLYKYNNFIIP